METRRKRAKFPAGLRKLFIAHHGKNERLLEYSLGYINKNEILARIPFLHGLNFNEWSAS
jgi:hypothetical protein